MPSTGLFPFLLWRIIPFCEVRNMCQCPQRAYSHFYKLFFVIGKIWMLCQCPQRAYSHFYYYIPLKDTSIPSIVSMPSTGLLPFLHIVEDFHNPPVIEACQCPQRAYFHFYWLLMLIFMTGMCVNALNGLTSISTVASRNPWFYWLPRAIFTSN